MYCMQKIRFIFILFLSSLLFLSCGGVKKNLRKANQQYELGNYFAAGELFKKSYSRLPYKDKELRAQTAFNQGECFQKTNNSRAEQAYLNAIRNKFSDSIVFLRLAQVQQKNGNYKEAEKNYSTYLSAFLKDSIAINGLKGIHFADSVKKNPTRYIIKRENNFNAVRSASFSPAFGSKENDFLVFTSNRKVDKKEKKTFINAVSGQPNNSLFQAKKNSKGEWEKPEIMEGEISTTNDEGITSFSSDGQTMYFTRSMTEENRGDGTKIVFSKKSGSSWSDPQVITLFSDTTISVAHPAIAPDDITLYFVSDNKLGYGGKDIWRTKLEDGKATFIENLGSEINTAGDELFPSFKKDGTLYFSSNGHIGLGGLDIFKATQNNDSTSWMVENIGFPINSSSDDFGITFAQTDTEEEIGFFSTNRNEFRNYDAIWSFYLPRLTYTLEGKILAKNGSTIPNARINIVGDNGENARINAKGDGSYRYELQTNVKYLLQASSEEYLNSIDSIATFDVNKRESQVFTKNFNLIPTFQSVKLSNIFYDFDKAALRSESKKELDELINMMEENPNITIELSSHTDLKGSDEYNRLLSVRRAQSVIDYLIEAGVDGARLKAIGYGRVKPFVVDAETAKMYDFLVQGKELTRSYIETLPSEQQETANQINRRTEFKIVSTTFNMN